MPMTRSNLGKQITDQVIRPAFAATNERLATELDRTVQSAVFPWDRTTRRRARPPAGSPRDIVDTGEFLRSRLLLMDGDTASHVWAVEYAAIILLGRRRNDGTQQPSRDWIGATLNRWDIYAAFAEEIAKRLG
jgi:hypothetical protein